DGPLRGVAESAAAQRSDVEYLGPLTPARVRREIAAAACVVAASTWHDVLPTIILEALAVGRPVPATRLRGRPYLGRSSGSGAAPTAGAMADGLGRAFASAGSLAAAARRRYEEHFTPEVLTRRLIEIYDEVTR